MSRVRVACLLLLVGVGIAVVGHRAPQRPRRAPAAPSAPRDARAEERDRIFTLLAYSIALLDWQRDEPTGHGLNIAAVLVDAEDRPVCWARNAIRAEGDATQHAEVRALTSYLQGTEATYANGIRLYSTLEPCAMCAGAAAMSGVRVVVYGEHARGSGGVFERLAHDGRPEGGLRPYPFAVHASPAPLDLVEVLDRGSDAFRPHGAWNASDARLRIHQQAAERFRTLRVEHAENEPVLRDARAFLARVPDHHLRTPYRVACPDVGDGGVAP